MVTRSGRVERAIPGGADPPVGADVGEGSPNLAGVHDGIPAHEARASQAKLQALEHARVCIVIPAFNEAGSIARVIQRVIAAVPEAHVVVVNDGSRDATAARAFQAGAAVITLPVNLGIGGAVQCGYRYALRQGYDIAIQVDGDDQHDPSEIERLLEPIRAGRADMTIGSRWLGRGDYIAPVGRRFGMRLLATLVRWRAGNTFTDTTSGFRAVGLGGIALFARTYPTDFPEVESLVLASRNGLRLEEVPVRMTPRLHGRSSIAGIRSAYYMARVTVALLIGGLNRDGLGSGTD
ncbi:MAG TPA: glycosyltransferase family 2 protein [Acidimicrobiales bacterium]|nr:glycosyltransferase family 2 protein [Acidimicrobiales bacterium]